MCDCHHVNNCFEPWLRVVCCWAGHVPTKFCVLHRRYTSRSHPKVIQRNHLRVRDAAPKVHHLQIPLPLVHKPMMTFSGLRTPNM